MREAACKYLLYIHVGGEKQYYLGAGGGGDGVLRFNSARYFLQMYTGRALDMTAQSSVRLD